MKQYLFSYGTLQKSEVQMSLFGRLLIGHRDVLSGYAISTVEINDASFLAKGEHKFQLTVVPSHHQNDIVEGTVFEISQEELLAADRYEPHGFSRVKVKLNSGTQAWIYSLNLPIA